MPIELGLLRNTIKMLKIHSQTRNYEVSISKESTINYGKESIP